jgi:C-terminal processing protease CtpA/Prc
MRGIFGLVGLLVTLGVVIMIWHTYSLPAAKQAITAKKQVEQRFGSNTSEGLADAKSSIDLEDVQKGNHFDSLLVKSVTAGGPMATDFGLVAGDSIVAIGGLRTRDMNDAEEARDKLFEAKLRQTPLSVIRNGSSIELTAK